MPTQSQGSEFDRIWTSTSDSPNGMADTLLTSHNRPMKRMRAVAAAALIATTTACGGSGLSQSWPGRIAASSNVDFYDETFPSTDVKVLCSKKSSELTVRITGPTGESATASQKADGAQVSDITVVRNNESKVLPGGAHWSTVSGETGFELDPSGDFDDIFYLHNGAAVCAQK